MTAPAREAILDASLLTAAGFERPAAPSALEVEVVTLFDQLRNGLLRYILSVGLSVPDGEEIVQEAFLALFQHLRADKSRVNLRGWVFRVGHNLALKQRNAKRRNLQCVAGSREAPGESAIADPGPNPEDQAAGSQKQERLLAVLRALPERDRRCLSLRAEGLRYREISEVLSMSLGAVSLSLGRSLARLGRVDGRHV
jgi:RNA polymerase sigma-70 factor (ECF subfamily)